jgi:anti-anti-sigma factor
MTGNDITIFDVHAIDDDGGSIGVSRRDGVAILDLQGEFDVFSAPQLRARCRAELDDGRGCVIDLRGAEFIDSAVLAALLDARRRSEQRDLRLVLVLPDGRHPVRRALDEAGLQFDRCADIAEAVRHVSRQRPAEAPRTAPSRAVPD